MLFFYHLLLPFPGDCGAGIDGKRSYSPDVDGLPLVLNHLSLSTVSIFYFHFFRHMYRYGTVISNLLLKN